MMVRFDNNKTISNPNSDTMNVANVAQGNYKQLNLDGFHASSQSFMSGYDSGTYYDVNHNYMRFGKLCYIPSDTRSRYQ
jgi:hypothetical protein